jgi:hypothetical protein
VSVGWPKGSRKAIAQCWKRQQSEAGVNEIFITPELNDSTEVLAALTHELIHAMDDCASGHKGAFASLAKAIGFEAPLTELHPSDDLTAALQLFVDEHGDIPHAKLSGSAKKKQTTRMLKIECGNCGFKANTTKKWIDQMVWPALCPLCNCQTLHHPDNV